jgi:hypothetical protein
VGTIYRIRSTAEMRSETPQAFTSLRRFVISGDWKAERAAPADAAMVPCLPSGHPAPHCEEHPSLNTSATHPQQISPALQAPHANSAGSGRALRSFSQYTRRALLALLFTVTSIALAGPAPWYLWRSKVDGRMVCAQTSLGPGWERALGPFSDSRCAKRAIVK